MRRQFGKWEASRKPKSIFRIDDARCAAFYDELEQNGLTSDLNPLTANQVREMHEYLCSQRWCDEQRPELSDFAFNEIPKECGIASVPLEKLVRTPHIFSLANHPAVLPVLERYFGCKPRLEELYVSWSAPQEQSSAFHRESPCAFHRDTDGMQTAKLFLYLTDIDTQSGPHFYVLNSHRRNLLTRPGTFTDAEVTDAFGNESIASITGTKGKCFLEDTFGIHKATMPESANRMLLQLIYASHPTICPPKRPVIAASELPGEDFKVYDPYVCEKFVTQRITA
jgi:hypothetical protein